MAPVFSEIASTRRCMLHAARPRGGQDRAVVRPSSEVAPVTALVSSQEPGHVHMRINPRIHAHAPPSAHPSTYLPITNDLHVETSDLQKNKSSFQRSRSARPAARMLGGLAIPGRRFPIRGYRPGGRHRHGIQAPGPRSASPQTPGSARRPTWQCVCVQETPKFSWTGYPVSHPRQRWKGGTVSAHARQRGARRGAPQVAKSGVGRSQKLTPRCPRGPTPGEEPGTWGEPQLSPRPAPEGTDTHPGREAAAGSPAAQRTGRSLLPAARACAALQGPDPKPRPRPPSHPIGQLHVTWPLLAGKGSCEPYFPSRRGTLLCKPNLEAVREEGGIVTDFEADPLTNSPITPPGSNHPKI